MATNNSVGRLIAPAGRSADKTADFGGAALICCRKLHPSSSVKSKFRWWSARRNTSAITLVELLVEVAVIALLIALAFPALRATIETSRRATCVGNLKTLSAAVLSYAGEHSGSLPYTHGNPADIETGPAAKSWFWAAGDYIGSKYTRAQELDWSKKRTFRGLPGSLYCPSAKRETNTSTPYDVSYGINAILAGNSGGGRAQTRISSVPRHSSMLLLTDSMSYSEKGSHAWSVRPATVSRRHTTEANVAWLDGHVSRESINELATNESYWDRSKN